jgi:hypothetical protein
MVSGYELQRMFSVCDLFLGPTGAPCLLRRVLITKLFEETINPIIENALSRRMCMVFRTNLENLVKFCFM